MCTAVILVDGGRRHEIDLNLKLKLIIRNQRCTLIPEFERITIVITVTVEIVFRYSYCVYLFTFPFTFPILPSYNKMPSPTKKLLSRKRKKDYDSDSTRTPSPVDRESRSRQRKRSGKTKRRRRRSDVSSSSQSSISPIPDRRKTKKKNRRDIPNVLEKLVSLLSAKSDTGAPSSVGPGLQGSQNVIPGFDPNGKSQTMKNWLAKVNESAHVFGWTERQTIFYALPKLEGLAKKWYEGLITVKYTWAEWQNNLIAAFPCEHNYGDLLTEMLARRSRKNETLEEYYYDKMTLINRCELTGKRAVDCVSHGIYDYNVRMNVQGGDFKEPEEVLKYLRNISSKTNDATRKPFQSFGDSSGHSQSQYKKTYNYPQKKEQLTTQLQCFNCKESGHMVTMCPKPIVKCTKCRRFGHTDQNCKNPLGNRYNNESRTPLTMTATTGTKNVLNIACGHKGVEKYYKQVLVENKPLQAFVDLGSQCTLLNEDLCEMLNVSVDKSNLPTLNGFGNGSVVPSGRIKVRIVLDGLNEEVEVYLVKPVLLATDMLIGHTLTELPGVRAYKTDSVLFMYKEPGTKSDKIPITCLGDTVIHGLTSIPTKTGNQNTGIVYVDTIGCSKSGEEYIVMPGIYTVRGGLSSLLVMGLNSESFTLSAGTLIARAVLVSANLSLDEPYTNTKTTSISDVTHNILRIESCDDPILKEQIIVDDDLDEQIRAKLCSLLNERRKCFAFSLKELGKTTLAEMQIKLKDDTPITYRPYRLSLSERSKVKEMVSEMLNNNIIQESISEYASPIILVAKKSGDTRLCVDYRALNQKTLKEKYPMPLIDDQIDRLSGQVFFTSLDLTSGYYQVPVSEGSKHLTAFVTPDGHYEYNRMPFGLTNAPAVFQRLILSLLRRQNTPGVMAYMDDIIIASKTVEEGLEKLSIVLDLIQEANLTLNLSKCHFFKRSIDYLGFEVSSKGVRPGARKVEAVRSFKTPENVHEVRQFVGLASFFRRFVEGFASTAKPLTSLTKSNVPWVWGEAQEKSFKKLKEVLISRPVLAIFNPDYKTELHTDASSIGLGGILLQRATDSAPLQAVAYFSRQTTPEEHHFHSYELETLAVVSSLNRFRVYLLGIEFKVVTDCNALRTTLTKRDLIPRIARWWLLVQEYTFNIEYRPGAQLAHADALSRNPNFVSLPEAHSLNIMQINDVHWLQAVQLSDPLLSNIKAVLDAKSAEAKEVRSKYELKDGKIFRKTDDGLRWVVPKDARWKICQQCHDEAGHFSIEKTLEKMKRDYWFPKMAQFGRKYVKACIPCAYSKHPGGKKQGFLHPLPKPNVPFQCLHIDHLGPFVKSKKNNAYILGIIDAYTKFIVLRAVKDTRSKTSISVLRDVFAMFGTPRTLISDRGTSFTSKEFESYIQNVGVKHVLNAVATPRANGQIERYNRSILSSLTALCHGNDDRHWDKHVPDVQWSLNNTINQSTGKSPMEIIMGRPSIHISEGHLHDINDKNEKIDVNVQKIRDEASFNITKQQEKMKLRYDKKRCKARKYEVDDLVMVQKNTKTPGESNKLIPAFNGPYKISAVYDHDRYEVSSIEGYSKRKYINVFSVDKIKPWCRFTGSDESESSSCEDSE